MSTATLCLQPTSRPTTRQTPASRPLRTSTQAFDSTSRPDDTISRKPTAHDHETPGLAFNSTSRTDDTLSRKTTVSVPHFRFADDSLFHKPTEDTLLPTASRHRKPTDDMLLLQVDRWQLVLKHDSRKPTDDALSRKPTASPPHLLKPQAARPRLSHLSESRCYNPRPATLLQVNRFPGLTMNELISLDFLKHDFC